MIPILYDSGETAFTSNGLGRLVDCVSCKVTEERNGIFECEFQYPVTGRMYDQIIEGRIIAVTHDDAHDIQPFDIYRRSAPIDGLVTFNAHHISYRLGNVILRPYTATSCAQALALMETECYNSNPFTFWTDKAVSKTYTLQTPAACKAMLGGETNSVLSVFGTGEYEWDKWTVKLHLHRGADHGVTIRYGVNLTSIEQEKDISGMYTAVAPFWKNDESGVVVTLPEGIVTATGQSVTVPVPLDLSSEFESAPTEVELRAKAQSVVDGSNAWVPDENIKVSFVNLAQTEDYKDFAVLQRVQLCDRVTVYDSALNVAAVSMQVIRVVYNTLTDTYDEMELGTARTSFADTIMAQVESIMGQYPSRDMMADAIQSALDLIAGGTGGHVVIGRNANGEPNEILIMDTADTSTAVNVIRINAAGIGFSTTGYNGPFETAWTIDGSFVADFITAGTINANLIKAGILTGANGLSYWNLETGELKIAITNNDGADMFLSTLMWVDSEGLHIGLAQSNGEVVISNTGVKIKINGEAFAQFAANYVQFGNYQMRRTADGGIAFRIVPGVSA